MDLHHLRIFITIYNKRSFSLASKALNISQPTISEHVKNLETELETSLFDRLPRTIIPTKTAEAIYPKAIHILEEAESLKNMVLSTSTSVKGALKIGSSTIPGTYIIPRAAGAFKNSFPDVSFEVIIGDSQNITEKVINHDLALGVTGAIIAPEKLNYTTFATDSMVLASAPSMIAARELEPADLKEIPIIFREKGSGTRKTAEEHLHTLGIKIHDMNLAGTLGSNSAVKEAVLSGLGASFFSRLSIAKELESGTMQILPVRNLEMKRKFYIISHKRRHLSTPYRQFMDSLLTQKS